MPEALYDPGAISLEENGQALCADCTDTASLFGRVFALVQPIYSARNEAAWLKTYRETVAAKTLTHEEKVAQEISAIDARLADLSRQMVSLSGARGLEKATMFHAIDHGQVVALSAMATDRWTDNHNLPCTLAEWRQALGLDSAGKAALLARLVELDAARAEREATRKLSLSVQIATLETLRLVLLSARFEPRALVLMQYLTGELKASLPTPAIPALSGEIMLRTYSANELLRTPGDNRMWWQR